MLMGRDTNLNVSLPIFVSCRKLTQACLRIRKLACEIGSTLSW